MSPALPGIGRADSTYPSRSVRMIVAFGAGGPGDVFARLMAEKFSEHFGQQFFVENIVGAGGNIGAEKAAKSAPDGYTILINANNQIINPLLYETVPYDPVKDFAPVSLAAGFPTAFSVNQAVPARTVAELVALVRATPGKFSYASAGVGTPSHPLGERFRQALNLDIVHVPYSGSGPATQAVLAGDTQICFAGLTAAAPLVPTGKILVLATMSKTRSHALPDVPTIAEAGLPGFESATNYTLFAPKAVSPDIVKKLNVTGNEVVRDAGFREKMLKLGIVPAGSTQEETQAKMSSEMKRWADVIQKGNIKPS